MLEQQNYIANNTPKDSSFSVPNGYYSMIFSGTLGPQDVASRSAVIEAVMRYAHFSSDLRQHAEGVRASEQIARATVGAQGKSMLDSGIPVYVTTIEQLGNGGPVEAFETAMATTPKSEPLNSGRVLAGAAATQLAMAV